MFSLKLESNMSNLHPFEVVDRDTTSSGWYLRQNQTSTYVRFWLKTIPAMKEWNKTVMAVDLFTWVFKWNGKR